MALTHLLSGIELSFQEAADALKDIQASGHTELRPERCGQEHVSPAAAQHPAGVLLPGCVTMGQSLALSGPQTAHLKNKKD